MRRYLVYIFFALFLVFIALVTKLANYYKTKFRIENVVITNNRIIPTGYLLNYIHIKSKEDLISLTPEIILDRIEKHPYVLRAEGYYVDSVTFNINVVEIQPFAIVIANKKNYVITEDKQIIPLLPEIMVVDLPVITLSGLTINPDYKKNLSPEIENVISTLLTIKKVDNGLFNVISELTINEKNKDLICFLTKPRGRIILGKVLDQVKAVYFSEFWRQVILTDESDNYDYIDFRFNNQIVVKKM